MDRLGGWVVFLVLGVIWVPQRAQAVATHFLVGGVSASALVTGSPAPYTGAARSLAYGGGLIFEFRMFSKLTLETGAYYMPRGFIEGLATPIQVNFTTLQIPLLLRVYVTPGFSIGMGPYFSHGLGSILSYPVSDPGSVTTTQYNAFSFDTDDIGAELSIALQMSIIRNLSLVLRGQLLYGLTNINELSNAQTTLYDLQFFGGIKLGG